MSNINSNNLKTLTSQSLSKVNQGHRRTHTFNVDFSDHNEEFVGIFKVHYPTQMENLQMGVLKSTLLGGNFDVDTTTNNIAHIISTLDIALDSKPDWFDVDNPDLSYEIMMAVYDEYSEWVSSFRNRVRKNTDKTDSTDKPSEVSMVDTKDI